MSPIIYRILTAVVGLPVLILAILFGFPWLSILVGIVALIGVQEVAGLASQRGLRPFVLLTVAWVMGFVVAGHFIADGLLTRAYLSYTFGTGLAASLIWATLNRRRPTIVLDWSYTTVGAIYVGWFLSHALLLRGLAQGWQWVLIMLIGTFVTDTSAFFVGKAIGKHRMIPSISPGKTWEGAVGGFIGAVLAVPFMSWGFGISIATWQAVLLGGLIGIFAQVGDVVESIFKRLSDVKDSGRILPGHGGILDRLDSVVFNIVIVYYFAVWVT